MFTYTRCNSARNGELLKNSRKSDLPIVLLRNANAPPSQWELGRITECHPGNDRITRVVTVKTARSSYKRPVVKLCFLSIDINVETATDSRTAGGAGTTPSAPIQDPHNPPKFISYCNRVITTASSCNGSHVTTI